MKKRLPAVLCFWLMAAFLTGCKNSQESYLISGGQETGLPGNTKEETLVMDGSTAAGEVIGSAAAGAAEGTAAGKTAGAAEGTAIGKTTGSGTVDGAAAESSASGVDETETLIYVHVCGEVAAPGVYELPAGSRAYEAIEMAGGMTADARGEAVNLASALMDGQQLWIPSTSEQAEMPATAQTQSALVNINLADAQELMTLPGIGEAKAADIIAYREAHGPFASIEDIKNVSGIKDALFGRIKDKIVV